MTVSVGDDTVVLPCSEIAGTKVTEEDLRKEVPLEVSDLQEGNIKNRATITIKKTARIRHVIIGVLPYVKITKLNRDANLAISAYSDTVIQMCECQERSHPPKFEDKTKE